MFSVTEARTLTQTNTRTQAILLGWVDCQLFQTHVQYPPKVEWMPGIQLIVCLQLPAACSRESVCLHLSSPSVVPSLLSPAASSGRERNFYIPAPGQSWTRSTLPPPASSLLQSQSGTQTTSIIDSLTRLILASYIFALTVQLTPAIVQLW